MHKIILRQIQILFLLLGFVLAGLLLGAGPAPAQPGHALHWKAPVSSDGKDWTAPAP